MTAQDEMNAMLENLKEELNSNSLQMEQLSEDVRGLMYAVRDLTAATAEISEAAELETQRRDKIMRANATANARMTMGQSGG
jgi:uncharacterized protein YoxC